MSEDLKQNPPASIESDTPSEYMRGYSDGLAQAEETIAAAIQRAKSEELEALVNRLEALEFFYCSNVVRRYGGTNENAR